MNDCSLGGFDLILAPLVGFISKLSLFDQLSKLYSKAKGKAWSYAIFVLFCLFVFPVYFCCYLAVLLILLTCEFIAVFIITLLMAVIYGFVPFIISLPLSDEDFENGEEENEKEVSGAVFGFFVKLAGNTVFRPFRQLKLSRSSYNIISKAGVVLSIPINALFWGTACFLMSIILCVPIIKGIIETYGKRKSGEDSDND